MPFVPYLNFDGHCAEAFDFYRELFRGEIVQPLRYGDMPDMPDSPPIPPEGKDLIANVTLKIGAQTLMGSDAMPGATEACAGAYRPPQGLSVSIALDSLDEGRRIYAALVKGGTIRCRWARPSGRPASPWSRTATARRG